MDSKTINQIRELTNAELPQLNSLVSESFGYESPHSFFEDFPVWESPQVKRMGIFENQKLIAHVGMRFCEMQTPSGHSFSMAMVGAVATDEAFRGKGLSTKLLNEACRISEERNCDWTILWGSEHDFYKKFGFELQGEQIQAPLMELEDLPENKIPRVSRGWNPKIFDHFLKTKIGIKFTENDRLWLSNHETVNWFFKEEPFAFAAFERGLDLPHMIHEFGGDPIALKEILAFILSLDLGATVLGTREILSDFGFKDTDFIEEYLCLARPHSKKSELKWLPEFWVSGLSAC